MLPGLVESRRWRCSGFKVVLAAGRWYNRCNPPTGRRVSPAAFGGKVGCALCADSCGGKMAGNLLLVAVPAMIIGISACSLDFDSLTIPCAGVKCGSLAIRLRNDA